MGTTAQTVAAPAGSHFETEEVAVKGGTEKFESPILIWDNTEKMLEHFGEEGVLAMADGTSFRVAYQAIARRGKLKEKAVEETMQLMIDYKPGKRSGATSTPANKTARQAKELVDKNPEAADEVQKLMAAIASGKISIADLKAING